MKIRTARIDSDCSSITEIWNKSMSVPVTEGELRQAFETNPPNVISRRLVAEEGVKENKRRVLGQKRYTFQ